MTCFFFLLRASASRWRRNNPCELFSFLYVVLCECVLCARPCLPLLHRDASICKAHLEKSPRTRGGQLQAGKQGGMDGATLILEICSPDTGYGTQSMLQAAGRLKYAKRKKTVLFLSFILGA